MLPSIFEIFKIGIGPSSSHTLGALNCAKSFVKEITPIINGIYNKYKQNKQNEIYKINKFFSIKITLYGSFALTGKGHLTHYAAVAGLTNYKINIKHTIKDIFFETKNKKFIKLKNIKISFDPENDIIWNKDITKITHPNTIEFTLYKNNTPIFSSTYISIGGGNIRKIENNKLLKLNLEKIDIKGNPAYNKIDKFNQIIEYCKNNKINIIDFFYSLHEKVYNFKSHIIKKRLNEMWQIMQNVIEKGLNTEGILPGSLLLERRAKKLYYNFIKSIRSSIILSNTITLANIYAIAVAEENASGSVIVTAPTCGSAGVLPAVLKTLKERYFLNDKKIIEALIVAGIVGSVIFKNGSISGAEVGCQGEIGTASSMTAAATTYILGGSLHQIEYAAEIALEHHLGLTCDPVDGLVQIPCIERNAVGAVTALNAANIALLSNEKHHISFDNAINAMKETGLDMNNKYKETSLGGLAKVFKC